MAKFHLFNFQDFVVINRPKFASRLFFALYEPWFKKVYGEDLYQYDLQSALVYDFEIKVEDDKIKPYKEWDWHLDKAKKNTDLTTKVQRLDFINREKKYTELFKENLQILTDILEGTYDKPIYFIYRNIDKFILSATIQDIDALKFKWNFQSAGFLKFGNPEVYDKLISIFKKVYPTFNPFINDDVNFNIPPLLEYIHKSPATEADIIRNFLSILIEQSVLIDGLHGNHKGRYLVELWPLLNRYENIKLINLDKNNDIDFPEILNKEFSKDTPIISDATNTDVKLVTLKEHHSIIKNIIDSDFELRKKIDKYYDSEILMYNYISIDKRNII